MATTETGPAAAALETIACDLCGSGDHDLVLRLRDRLCGTTDLAFSLVRCRRCGLQYLNPRPAPETLGRYYPADYAPFNRRGLAARIKARFMEREIDALWALLAPPARVLDLGCATGDLLQAIRDRGNADVVGIEPSAQAAAIARDRGLDVHTGDLQQAHLPDASIDVALLSHVIEHLPSPSDTLAELRRIVRPGGRLVLWLPNGDSLAARVWRDAWIGYDAPRHLYTFTPATLGTLLDRHGFALRRVRHEWVGLEWSWGLRLLARERWGEQRIDRLLVRLHPLLTAACTPASAIAAGLGHAGRIRVIADRRPD